MSPDTPPLIPATPQQQGIWFYSLTHGTAYWNFVDIRSFKGCLNLGALTSALKTVINRHSALRTNFRVYNENLYQVVNEMVSPGDILRFSRYEDTDPANRDYIIRTETEQIQQHEFDLEKEALIKLRILQFDSQYYFLLSISHIVIDKTAMQVFWDDLAEFYDTGITTDRMLLRPRRQYADFSLEQIDFLTTAACEAQRKYWLDRLSAEVPVLDLPFYKNRQDARVYGCDKTISPDLAAAIRSFSLKKRFLYSAVFQAAYFILLYRYAQKDKIMIGNVSNGRGGAGKGKNDGVIGVFANTLLNIQEIDELDDLLTFAGKVNDDLIRSFNNADVPYDDWIKQCPVRNKDSSLPLFQAAFNVIKAIGPDTGFGDMEECPAQQYFDYLALENQYDINLFIINERERVTIRLELRCAEKWHRMANTLLTTYLHILNLLVYRCDDNIMDIDWLPSDERALLASFNETVGKITDPAIIHELFRRRVTQSQRQIALLCDKEELSYEELDRQSDELAGCLTAQGIGRGDVVAILMRRSAMMVKSILAVLKAGAAYLPLDPDYPMQRLAYMLQDAQAVLVLTEKVLTVKLPESATTIFVEDLCFAGVGYPVVNISQPDDLAYLIYTSGSTGNPKGVMIGHRSVVNLIDGITAMMEFAGRRVYSLTTISFDMFVIESLLSLCSGATVILAKEEEQKNPSKAAEAILAGHIDILHVTPSRMKMLLREGPQFLAGLSDIIMGGEAFPSEILDQIKKGCPGRVHNMYGPTETTVYSSGREVTRHTDITTGPPMMNTQIYILDKQGRVQGVGVTGEIGIAGAGVAQGYWRLPALTAQKFVQDSIILNERVYISGDIGRWTPDGELEVIGRNDSQIKIRGYRVELDDIAFHLKTHPDIKDTVVICVREKEYDDLYAYYLSDRQLEARQLRIHLRRMLPEFMIPSYFVHMQSFPLTPNNKVDRVALKHIKGAAGIKAFADYQNINSQLLTLWINILQVDNELFNERIFDNFFESGGHSLKALSILDAIEKEFHIKIPVRDFFKYPTLQFLNAKLTINN